jgi:aminoglycoside 6'-N-acetyltransferase I
MAEHIETFKIDHLDECAHLLMIAFNAEPWNARYTLDTAKKELSWILGVPGFVGLVSLADKLVAFATGYVEPEDEQEVFYLKTFCVSPDAQRTGVGARLLEHLKEHVEKSGVNSIYLITHKGTAAEAFYRKYGYKVNSEDIVMTHKW